MSFLKTYLKILSVLLILFALLGLLIYLTVKVSPVFLIVGIPAIAAIPIAMVEAK